MAPTKLGRSGWAVVGLAVAALFLINFTGLAAEWRNSRLPWPLRYPFVWQFTGHAALFAVLPLLLALFERLPLTRNNYRTRIPTYLAAMVGIATLIVDDEPPARRRLAALLQAVAGFVQVGEARDGLEAVLAIQELRPDLVLLDVQLPGLDGFEVLRTVGVDRAPAVVFVTAFDTFAVEAFAVEAVDYLVKPVDADRFRSALTRVARRLIPGSRSQPGDAHAPIDRLLGRVLPPRPHLDSLVVRAGTEVEQIPVHSVERLRAAGNYVEVFASGRSHLIRDTLAHLHAQLDPSRFVRIHRGEVVALEAIREVLPSATGDAVLVLASGATVRMSRRFADERVRPA